MARIKVHELRQKSKTNLLAQLKDLKADLSLLRVAKATGGAPNKLPKIGGRKVVRLSNAQVLTLISQKQKAALLGVYTNKKYLPLDLHSKKTPAIRRRLTRRQGSEDKHSTTSDEDYDDLAMEDSDETAMAKDNGLFVGNQTIGTVLCPKCGISMAPNDANMCVTCLRSEVDITEGLQKHVIIIHCPECDCYLQPPRTWLKAQLESKELKTFCVKRLKNLNTVKLIDAKFIWTEPHSKRLKIKLWVQKEVLNGAILEQTFVVDYVVQDQMCESCSRVQANPDQWVASVQLRQHVTHRRTFFYLEQLILKHDAAVKAIRIKQMDQGIDFLFGNRSHARNFVEFIEKVAPIRTRNDKQLVSHDSKSNYYNYKYTFSVEICPICREDLICLPPKVAENLGRLVICTKVTNRIALVDPFTLTCCALEPEKYWRTPFMPLLSSRQLVEYIVLDIEPVSSRVNVTGSKYILADAQIARVSDFGKNNTIFNVKTHLGHILNPGDFALGYDLYGANNNDVELDQYKGLVVPDAILIKKSYEEKRQKKHAKPRSWKLKSLNMEVDNTTRTRAVEEKRETEYEQFLRDLEENPEMRFNVSLYRNKEYQPSEIASMTDGKDVPSVSIEELFDDLDLGNEDEDNEEGNMTD